MDDPWFTTYRGRGKLQIMPRNAAGWIATAVMVLLTTGVMLGTVPLVATQPVLIILPLLATMTILFVFIRFAMARSETINIDEIADEIRARRARGGK